MWKNDLNAHAFQTNKQTNKQTNNQTKKWCGPKSYRFSFFLLWLSEGLSIGRILNEKKKVGGRVNF